VSDSAKGTPGAADPTWRTTPWRPPDARRLLQLALAAVWLLDGVLQLQPFFFTGGSHGFSGMLAGNAAGNPHAVARSILWNASVVDHHAVVTNSAFALIQILLGLGIAWRPTLKPALGASIVWSLAVWWFGEGLGRVLAGAGTPVGGGPGAVLFYALLAILLWPADRVGSRPPFAAARAVGLQAATIVWVVAWAGLAVLALLGSGRSPQGIYDLIDGLSPGEPGWLLAIDRHAGTLVSHEGLAVAVTVAAVCLVVGAGIFLPVALARATLVLAIVTAAVLWIVGQAFGTILAGGATDPNSGPLLVLFALAYWPGRGRPLTDAPAEAASPEAALPVSVA
jgi:hypothetical protein